MSRGRWTWWGTMALGLALQAGCRRETPSSESEPSLVVVDDARTDLLLVWIDESGETHVATRASEVPEAHRAPVRIIDPKAEGHSERILLADLTKKDEAGHYAVRVAPRAELEDVLLARRRAAGVAVEQPPAAGARPAVAGSEPDNRPAVIIYGAAWCGPCHQAAAYLRNKGVQFIEKDIEKDPVAAREMSKKLERAGMAAGSIPVLDVRGKMLQGFSEAAVDAALGKGA